MASAAVFWNYQRKLSVGSGGQSQNEEQRAKAQRSKRTVSESSTTSFQHEPVDRRNSAGDSSDEEALEQEQTQNQATKSKGKRRFSLDFLFNRKPKDKREKKQKNKRSQSTSEASEAFIEDNANHFRAYRYPGFTGAEFALMVPFYRGM